MKIFYLLTITLLISIGFISALGPVGEKGITVQIQNNTITIGGYTIVQDPSTTTSVKVTSDNLFINKVVNTSVATITCESINVPVIINGTYNGTNQTIIPNYTYSSTYLIDVPFTSQNITNTSSLFCISQDKYETCLADKQKYSTSFDLCYEQKKAIQGFEGNYTQCATSLSACQTERNTCNTDKESLTMQLEKNKNSKYAWGFVCGLLGILGALYFKGHIWQPKPRNPEGNYNRGQSS